MSCLKQTNLIKIVPVTSLNLIEKKNIYIYIFKKNYSDFINLAQIFCKLPFSRETLNGLHC